MEINRPGQDDRELALRKYFKGLPEEPSTTGAMFLALLGLGIALVAAVAYLNGKSQGTSDGSGAMVFIIIGVIMAGIGILWRFSLSSSYEIALQEVLPQPTDTEVDSWLHEGLRGLRQHSKNVLTLDESESNISNPICIIAPTLQTVDGIPPEEVTWRKGSDARIRFSAYKVAIIHMTQRHLGVFICDFDFIRNVSLNESTQEYHYCDVVSVSTHEKSQVSTEPTGEKNTISQVFALSVSSGESIQIPIEVDKIKKMTGMQENLETGAPNAVRTIRAMLRDKKEAVEGKAA